MTTVSRGVASVSEFQRQLCTRMYMCYREQFRVGFLCSVGANDAFCHSKLICVSVAVGSCHTLVLLAAFCYVNLNNNMHIYVRYIHEITTTSLNKCANAWNSFSLSETKPTKCRMWSTLHTYIHAQQLYSLKYTAI